LARREPGRGDTARAAHRRFAMGRSVLARVAALPGKAARQPSARGAHDVADGRSGTGYDGSRPAA
jgi:hypothetical protein